MLRSFMGKNHPNNEAPPRQRHEALKRLLVKFKPFKSTIGVIVVLGLIVSAIQPLCVKIVEEIVNRLSQGGMEVSFYQKGPLLIVAIFAVSGLAKYFYNTLRREVSEKVILELREDLFKKYLYFPLSIIHQKRSGEMLSNVQNDLVQVNVGIETLADLLKEPFTFLGLLGVAFYCDWQLAMSTLVVAPLVGWLFSQSGRAVKRYSSANMKNFERLLSLSQESLSGSSVVKIFHLENALVEKFVEIQKQYLKMFQKTVKVQELATPAVEFIGAMLMAGVLIYGGYKISQGTLTSGELVAFVIALGLAQMPIKKLNNAYLKLKQAEAAAERIFKVMDIKESEKPAVKGAALTEFRDSIEFSNVDLSYGTKTALQGINLRVRRGECLALVGQSGSGKSSLVHLLGRLFEPTHGSILIDGKDIKHMGLYALRRLVSYVSQDTFLFHDTLLENIRMGLPEATDAQVEEALEMAHCREFIHRFPEGIHTLVGERGVTLSGGERQRVAIARALLKGAPILVLDEATSNLDSDSESQVQKALEGLMANRTSFLVAHRFSTIRKAHRIAVLEKGRMVQLGTHHELIKDEKGAYHKLYEQQHQQRAGLGEMQPLSV